MARICEKRFAMSMEAVPLPQHLAARYLDRALILLMLRNGGGITSGSTSQTWKLLEHEDV